VIQREPNSRIRLPRKNWAGTFLWPWFLLVWLVLPPGSRAETLILTEPMDAILSVRTINRILLPGPTARLSCRMVHPPDLTSPSSGQKVVDFRLDTQPQPTRIEYRHQNSGAKVTEFIFENETRSVTFTRRFEVRTVRRPDRLLGDYPYPLMNIPQAVRSYLDATASVQKDDPAVGHLSRVLVQWLSSQDQAIRTILDWIADNIKPDPTARPADALSVLNSGHGSAEGLAHLAAAMLRRIGVPTRVVAGLAADGPWRIRTEQNTWLTKIGQGRHGWIEVYFPGQGWVECDPLLSRYVVSPYYFRLEEGLDAAQASVDGSITWSGGLDQPGASEEIDLKVLRGPETVAVSEEWERPRNLVLAAPLNSTGRDRPPFRTGCGPIQPFRPARLSPDRVGSWPRIGPFTLGPVSEPLPSVEFAWSSAQTSGSARPVNEATAGLAIGKDDRIYQGLILDTPFELTRLDLALARPVEAAGTVWVEIRSDRDGRPGETLVKTGTIKAEQIGPDPVWVRFSLPADPPLLLMPGIYWLRPIGEFGAAPVWSYSPGNPFGWNNDTLKFSTVPGESPETMNLDFFFRLHGFKRLPADMAAVETKSEADRPLPETPRK